MEEDIQITLRQHIEEAYQNAFDEDPQKGRVGNVSVISFLM